VKVVASHGRTTRSLAEGCGNELRTTTHEPYDDRVLGNANQRHALLITADKDFGELVFRQGRLNTGIVLIRLAGVPPTQKAEIVSDALASHGNEMRSGFSVITNKMLRIRPNRATS